MGGVFDPTVQMLSSFWTGLATLILAVVVFLIGWLIARLLTPVLASVFKLLRVDNLAVASGFKEILEKGNIKRSVSELLATTVYWILILIVVFISLTAAGIAIPDTVIAELLAFIPRLILAILFLIFSFFVARLFKGVVQTSAANTGINKPEVLGKVTEGAIIVFGTVLALQVVGIAAAFIASAFNIVLAAFCFGLALSLALGSRDLVKDWLESTLGRKKNS